MATNPQFVNTVHNAGVNYVTADGTTAKDVITGATNGTVVNSITIASTNTTTLTVLFNLVIGANTTMLARAIVPAATSSLPLVTRTYTQDDWPWLAGALANNQKFTAALSAALDSGKTLDITVFGGDL